MKRFWIAGGIAALLLTATVVWAAYTGPIRPRTVWVSTGQWVRTIYRNNPWQRECQCGMSGPGARCGDNDYNCFCGQSPYNNSSLYTCYEDPVQQQVTHNPATASGSVSCAAPGNNGWCRGGSLRVNGTEPVSGYAITRIEGNYDGSNNAAVSCNSASCNFTPPEGSGTFWYWAVSSYGDTSAKGSLAYKFDTVAPSVSLSSSGTSGSNGWYVSPVAVNASGSDATSGLASLTLSCGSNPCTIAAEGTTVVNASAVDVAGNSAVTSLTLKVDTVPPVPSLSLSGVSGKNGWYTSPVSVTAGSSDATSGVASAEVRLDGGSWESSAAVGEGVHTLTYRAADAAGNASGEQSQVVRVDSTPPAVTALLPAPDGQNGWYVSLVVVNGDAADSGSGLADLRGQVNGGGWQSLPFSLDGDGVYQVTLEGEDVAGNTRQRTVEVKLDSQPPALEAGLTGTPGSNGWYVSEVGLAPVVSDVLSGVEASRWRVDGGSWENSPLRLDDGVHLVEVEGEDRAGNGSSLRLTVQVDTVPPETAFVVNGKDGTGGWYTSPVQVQAQGTDATSGVERVLLQTNGAEWKEEGEVRLEDGVYHLSAYSVDRAGWSGEPVTLTVQVDSTPPVATFGSFPDRLSRTVTLTGSAADGTSGVERAELSLDGGSTWQRLEVVNGVWSVDWDTTTAPGGDHTLALRVTDAAGNQTLVTRLVRVANRGPSAWVTAHWMVWESGQVEVNAGDLPVKQVCIAIRDPKNRWPEVENCYDSLADVPREVRWDRRFADGTRAPAGSYTVRVEITDILGQSAVAEGEIVVPLLALLLPQANATPTPTLTPTPPPTVTAEQRFVREDLPSLTPIPVSTPTPTRVPVQIAAWAAAEAGRSLWPFLTLLGLAGALGFSAFRDERPQAIRKLAERMETIIQFNQEVK